MKVILTQDVPKIGRKYDIKNIADGYARNFLLPRRMALVATPEAESRIEEQRKRYAQEGQLNQELARKNIESVNGRKITIKEKANNKGNLFAGLNSERVSEAIKAELKISIPSEMIVLADPIKTIGEHSLTIKSGDAKAKFVISVEAV